MTPRHRIRVLAAGSALALLIVACREITAPEAIQKQSGESKSLLNPSGLVVVYPDSMRGWVFYNDQTNAVCPTGSACRMVQGPATPPLGAGSAELYDSLTTDGKALILSDYAGTRFDQITDLHYSTYRQTANTGNNLAISLQFNVDYDLGDAATGYQGRFVFEPYVGIGGNVPENTWQTWDAKAGKWWGTRSTVTRNGASVANPCVQATPCTWAQALASFPNVGVHTLYGAVVLKAGSGWPGFRGNVDKLTIGVAGTATTFDFEVTAPQSFPATISMQPPDSTPSWVTADTNIVLPSADFANKLAAQVLGVAFLPSADGAVRGTALAALGLRVIGGLRTAPGLEGLYLVAKPGVRSFRELDALGALLRAQPGVDLATVYMMGGGSDYRFPRDGPEVGSWELSPAKAAGANWALERIAAPLAWGCSTGDSETDVGILDYGWRLVDDLTPNVYLPSSVHSDGGTHGLSVASVIAARGDNRIGMAGVMWRARLRLRARHDTAALVSPLEPAFLADVRSILALALQTRVINLSGYGMTYPANQLFTAAHVAAATVGDSVVRWMSGQLSRLSRPPLIVLSAGNRGVDASWNIFPLLAKYRPDLTLVVAATDTTNALVSSWWSSNVGPLVSVSAPGIDVAALDEAGDVRGRNGTSVAAPLVAGTAGLLFSFDSSLSARDVRDLIIAGAAVGRRGPVGARVVNAYESLKLAAQRHGAPLCGNRVWLNNVGQIMAERDNITMPAGESLVTTPLEDWESSYINTYHGGLRIDLAEYRQFNYNGVSRKFMEVPFSWPTSDELMGGTYRSSRWHENHDGTLGISFRIDGSGANTIVSDSVLDIANGYSVDPTKSSHFVISQDVPDSVCVRQSPEFDSNANFTGVYTTCDPGSMRRTGTFLELARYQEAMAPQGDFAIVALNFNTTAVGYDPWGVCSGADSLLGGIPRRCRAMTAHRSTSAHYRLLRVNLETKAWDYLPVSSDGSTMGAGRVVSWLSIGERGDEVVLELGRIENDRFGDYTCSNASTLFTALGGARDANGNAVATGTPRRTVALDPARWCDGVFDPSGTIAPLRAPSLRSTWRPSCQSGKRAVACCGLVGAVDEPAFDHEDQSAVALRVSREGPARGTTLLRAEALSTPCERLR